MVESKNIPEHIAIIMDGNGRWAEKNGLARSAGHREGVKRVREIIKHADSLGIKVLTVYAFSTENWKRPKKEVEILMQLLNVFLNHEIKKLDKENIRLKIIGNDDPFPKYFQEKIKYAQEKTKNNTGLTFVLALNYGGRQEIIDAVKKFTASVISGAAKIEDLNVDNFSDYFYTSGLPDPDLLIRTSGEVRISNFLLWQLSYSELYFTKKYWPEFKKEDLEDAIKDYQLRERRFGKVSVKK